MCVCVQVHARACVFVRVCVRACARVCVCVGFMAIIAAMGLCARSQDLVQSVSVRRVHVVLLTAGFKGDGKPYPKTRETAALRRGIQKASCKY